MRNRRASIATPGDAALEAFCLVVLNTNEFVYSN